MSTEQSKSPLEFCAELGDLIAKYASNSTYAIVMVVVGLVIWPIGALIASLLIANIYARGQRATEPTTASPSVSLPKPSEKISENDWLILLGLGLIAWGIYQWLDHYIDIPRSVALIGLGVLIVLFAFARRGGGPNA